MLSKWICSIDHGIIVELMDQKAGTGKLVLCEVVVLMHSLHK